MTGAGYIYRFGNGAADGDRSMSAVLGGKGSALAELTSMGINVPAGFTIGTEVCRHQLLHKEMPDGFDRQLASALRWLEGTAGRKFDDPGDPMMVSVRSGAPISMPGMMDTILNVGLTRAGLQGLAHRSSDRRFALDSYRRLIQMFGSIVLKVPKEAFDQALAECKHRAAVRDDTELSADALEALTATLEMLVEQHTGHPFPATAAEQIELAVLAVLESWQSDRAHYYRRLERIPDEMGTAVTIQVMVFGNRGESSGTGVGFTRNPSTGEKTLYGEFLRNAQGEDVVAGIRTPRPFAELATTFPSLYEELRSTTARLETHYRDVQDFEFTFEQGRLFLLQTRTAKRSGRAAVRCAVDMVQEGLISPEEAVQRVPVTAVAEILSPQLGAGEQAPVLTRGVAASAGAACGVIALSANEAVARKKAGEQVILVTEETSADDIHGMSAAVGFLTGRGGATSHAAVVARGMGKCCITGASGIRIEHGTGTVQIGPATLKAGDWLTLDGATGRVFAGRLSIAEPSGSHPDLEQILAWSRQQAVSQVRANADTPEDAQRARDHYAAGIGLCRTEHMFFSGERLQAMRSMILAAGKQERAAALAKLLPVQQSDFEQIFRHMSPLPVTIRLLDPPLHEFLPSLAEIDMQLQAAACKENAEELCSELRRLRQRTSDLAEVNPMMGLRGCRLSLTHPEILDMQVRAILQAAIAVAEQGLASVPEIMVPLIASEREMEVLACLIAKTADAIAQRHGKAVAYKLGTMIELPRAALRARYIAPFVDFISFGTNDLTQMTFGFSRDDARAYLEPYLEQQILTADPFQTIDKDGVGALMELAIREARAVKPDIKIGVCGEQAGDPVSIHYFSAIGVDYVSCSPARLFLAQLAAAQSSLASRHS